MLWDWDYAGTILPDLLEGLRVSLWIAGGSAIVALVGGALWGIPLTVRVPIVSQAAHILGDLVRGTPLIVQLFFLFYALPDFGISLSAEAIAVLGLGTYGAAYVSTIYAAGIRDVEAGQWEASKVLGLPRRWQWIDIVLPQAVRKVLPALGNYVILLFKYTPFVSFITVTDLMAKGLDLGQRTFRYTEPITLVGLIFLVSCIPAMALIRLVERRLARRYG